MLNIFCGWESCWNSRAWRGGGKGRRSPWKPEFIPGFIPPARRATLQPLDIPTLNFLLQQKQGTKARGKNGKIDLQSQLRTVPCFKSYGGNQRNVCKA